MKNGELGQEAKRRLLSLRGGLLKMADAKEEGDDATAAPRAAAVVITEDEDEDEDEDEATAGSTMVVAAATGDLEKRLQKFQKDFLTPMLAYFDERIQNPEVALRLRKIFDFRLMPLMDN